MKKSDYELSIAIMDCFYPAFKKVGVHESCFEILKHDLVKIGGIYSFCDTYAGPGEIGDAVIPDFEFGVAAWIHDCCYSYLRDCRKRSTVGWISKAEADRIFYNAMLQTPSNRILKKQRAWIYYKAVATFGRI